jgi:CheY-like chemotaxis protein
VSLEEPALAVNADPLRLAQVLGNLLSNAAKYTPPQGHVWLTARLEGENVAIRVRDDGDGISPDLLPRVFDLFVQGSRTSARSEGGLGLGLALVKSFVSLHGGTVSAASEGLGRGSEFVVRIPAITGLEAAPPSPPALPSERSERRRILVVDDNEDARELLAELLRDLGHEVRVAEDGPTALQELREFHAEVAILDLGLPVMDGFELARRVREQQRPPFPRLVALTGYGLDRDLVRTRAAGFDAHLVKPVDMADLVSAIEPLAGSVDSSSPVSRLPG